MLRARPGREGKQHLTQKPGRSRAAHRCAPAASPAGYCRASRTPASTWSPTHPGSPRASGAQEPASILTPLPALPLGALPLQLQAPVQASFALQPRWFTTASLPRTARYPGVCSRAQERARTGACTVAASEQTETIPIPARDRAGLVGLGSGEITGEMLAPLLFYPRLRTWNRCGFFFEPVEETSLPSQVPPTHFVLSRPS